MNILLACEYFGRVRDAFLKKGYNAISCDILPTESDGPHIRVDVKYLLKYDWDMIIAHPPCTYLCNSGVVHLKNNPERYKKMEKAVKFFKLFLNVNCDKICVENPIPHRYGIGKTYTQIIQPWQFGHGETKATCLWLKGLPKLVPTNVVEGREHRLQNLPPSKDRSKIRSLTFQGIANAMASQWG